MEMLVALALIAFLIALLAPAFMKRTKGKNTSVEMTNANWQTAVSLPEQASAAVTNSNALALQADKALEALK